MSNENRYAVIMAGGRGERFWPLSTDARPKQVLSLVGGRPMLAQAVERLQGLIPPERVLVITREDLAAVSREAAPELPPENIIGEPCGRDTAAACALGAVLVKTRCPENGLFCVLTADHVIRPADRFQQVLDAGFEMAASGERLVTIGIPPNVPSTGFGYIQCGDRIQEGKVCFHQAKRFVEKPDAETALQYLREGGYVWNSGMFVWAADALLNALRRFEPPVYAMAEALLPVAGTPAFPDALREAYNRLGRISIDYAVMEKAGNIVTASGDFEWYDVGSWPALEDHFPKDADGNVVIGKGELIDGRNNVVVSGERLTALIGVHDLVVVQAPGATLVCPKSRAQDVKEMVRRLTDHGGYRDVL